MADPLLERSVVYYRARARAIEVRWAGANGNARRRRVYRADMAERDLWVRLADELDAYLHPETVWETGDVADLFGPTDEP